MSGRYGRKSELEAFRLPEEEGSSATEVECRWRLGKGDLALEAATELEGQLPILDRSWSLVPA